MGGHDFPLIGSVDDGHLRITYQDIHVRTSPLPRWMLVVVAHSWGCNVVW